MSKTTMRIDITSDVICPFCLIGVKQLQSAIEQYKSLHPDKYTSFDLRLLPYQLNPALTEQPIPRSKYLADKFGAERAKEMIKGMGSRLAAVGCKADTSGSVSSTHLAHRLQTYTLETKPTAQIPLGMDLFLGFHSEGKTPSDKKWLSSIVVKHGIFPSESAAEEWLEGNECDEAVKKDYRHAKELGVTGVPFFVFQDKYAASGAMGVDQFVNLLEEISKREEKNSATSKIIESDQVC